MIKIEEEITVKEIAKQYGYTENYITSRFKTFQNGIEKKYGVKVRDNGRRGVNRKFYITKPIQAIEATEQMLPPDLPTIGDERFDDELAIALTDLGLVDYELMIIVYLIWLPMQSFRGSIPMFAAACKQESTESVLKGISEALDGMKNRGWIEIVPLNADRVFCNYSSASI